MEERAVSEGSEAEVPRCSLPAEQRQRRAEDLRRELLPRLLAWRPLPAGFAVRLPDDAESRRLAEDFVAFERGCCGFAEYAIRSDADRDAIWLEVRDPEDGMAALRAFVARSVPQEPDPGTEERGSGMLRAGVTGMLLSVVALLVCATPALALVLAGLGASVAVADAARVVDGVAIALLAAGLALAVVALRRRRRAGRTGTPRTP